jgi:Ca-activated chloride channel homolog
MRRILTFLLCLALLSASGACRRAREPVLTAPKEIKAVASSQQAIEVPSLAPPSPQPAEAPAEAPAPPPPPPVGPITVIPPPELPPGITPPQPAPPAAQVPPSAVLEAAPIPGTPPEAAAAPAPLAPATSAALPAAPMPVSPTLAEPAPAVPPSPAGPTTMPLVSLGGGATAGTLPPVGPKEDFKALPAPEVAIVPEAMTKGAEAVSYEPKLVTAQTNIELILDASGSMAAPFAATSQTKYNLLRQAVYDAFFEMGQQQAEFPRNIAVRLVGSKSDAQAMDCEDTDLAAGMGAPSLDDVRRLLEATTPRGQSPLALAITKASEDFPSGVKADRVIVLVADGWDNCGGDPCDVAKKLETPEQRTIIQTIAFDIAPEDQPKLECIAKATDGQFFLARNEAELRSALDQAVNSTIPYNLKLIAQAGGVPIPVNVTVLKAGTQEVVKRGESLGTKLLSLPPASYDVLVEYAQSPEAKKPSKILKGVEVLSTTRVEQTISFDLGQVTLAAQGGDGAPLAARYRITKSGGTELVAEVQSEAAPLTLFLTPGSYDIAADPLESQPDAFTVTESSVQAKLNENIEIPFKFQKGTLAIRGQTTQKESIPFLFQIYKAGSETLVGSGALPAEGGSVMLPPGSFDLLVVGQDPKMMASPRTRISGISIRSGETTELTAIFEMGALTLSAVDGKGNRLPAEFVVRDPAANDQELARATSQAGTPVQLFVPPGSYDVVAYSLKSTLEPKPSTTVPGVTITASQPVEQVIKFVLGTIRLRGRNVKEMPIRTQFTIFPAGSEQALTQAPPSNDWTVFDLAPGTYDALAADLTTPTEEQHPMIWIRDIQVEDGKTISHEAIFTAGKLKIIGRGPNNEIITTHFKVFKYGADRELINGQTADDWEIFQIEPGKYYIEAAYHDEEQAVMLKKWINVSVEENEIVEIVLRF